MVEQPDGPSRPGFVPVCAIGASAGGVGVLQTLFRLLPDDLGLAYVVVVHLAPDHPSAMHEILAACTKMPVFQVLDGPTLRANCVYVIPPDRELVIDGDDVTARPFTDPRGRRAPIDMFFRSVAAGRGDGIAVVLTGAGADGAIGVRAIKEAGGLVMVQEPTEAGFPSMPQNAIATGVADVVAPVARLAERIVEAARSKEAVRSLDADGAANDLRRIVVFLRTRTGHDFSGYKRSTVLRRVLRRMQVCQIDSLPDYARHLRSTPEEAKALFADLLISVTMFFRDPTAFEALRVAVVRPLLEELGSTEGSEEVRAWVVGCATGEEAYSLAILILEEAEQMKLHVPIQIFATDLDEGALATAREGRYPRTIEADVSAERLKRFFVDEGTHYRISRRVRDLVLFATHSVVREPPFMRLDLVTCRNVLIYLERAVQQHVCSIFHYGLKPDRYLFLGPAETADTVQDQFVGLDREARIYRARSVSAAPLPILPQSYPSRLGFAPAAEDRAAPARFEPTEVLGASHAAALETVAPPSVLVDADYTLLHLSATASRFFLQSAGPHSSKLPSMVRPELRLDLKLALDRAFDTGQATGTRYLDVRFDTGLHRVSTYVAPVPVGEGAGARATVFFLDNGPVQKAEEAEDAPPLDELRHLHSELKSAQEAALAGRLRHEAALQELRAGNEELQSLNEEYRSTAEELETSKEELQSINEELQTVNAELKSKLSVISAAHNDLRNLTDSSEIGTLFLDTELRIRMFTPPVADLINVNDGDVGRPVTDLTHRLDYDGIERDVRRVLRDLQSTEQEIPGRGERWFTMRVRPYRTLDGRVEGVVVTFDDITDRKRGEAALRASERQLQSVFDAMDEGYLLADVIFDREGCAVDIAYVQANPAAVRMVGADPTGKRLREVDPSYEPYWYEIWGRVAVTGRGERLERYASPGGTWYDFYVFKPEPENADSRRVAVIFRDVSERKRGEEERQANAARQTYLLKLADALRPLGDAETVRRTAARLLGEHLRVNRAFYAEVEGGDWVVRGDYERGIVPLTPGRYAAETYGAWMMNALGDGGVLDISDSRADERCSASEREALARFAIIAVLGVGLVKDGRLIAVMVVHSGAPRSWTAADLSLLSETAERTWAAIERAYAEMALRESEERQRLTNDLVPALLWTADPAGQDTTTSDRWRLYTGQSEAAVQNFGWLDAIHPDDREATQAAFAHAFATGEPIERQQRIHQAGDGYRWHLVRHVPVRDASGAIARWFGAAIDVHDLHELQDRQGVLVAELQHRTRNLMGVVQALFDDTLEATTDLDTFAAGFRDRLGALSRVQGLLSRLSSDERVMFDALIRSELQAMGARLDGTKVTLEGPSGVALRSSTVQTFALAIHELATNAVKYGALKQPAGRLAVTWRLAPAGPDGQPWLHVDWRESGVAMPGAGADPQGTGQGRQLIEHALPYQLGAITTYVMADDGVRCTIAVPVSSRTAAEETDHGRIPSP